MICVVCYKIGIVKPQPEIYISCAKRLDVSVQECLFIDDSQINVDAGIKLGMQCFLYKDFNSLKSYLTNQGLLI